MSAVTKFTAFDAAAMDLTMGAPVSAGSMRMAYLATQPVIQFAKDMVAPYGLDDGTGQYRSDKHTVKLNAAEPALVAMLEAVDARLLDAVVADPAKFFPRPQSEAVMRALFSPTAKRKSDEHAPTVKFTLSREAATGAYTVPVVGADNTPVDPAGALAKFARVTPVAKLGGLWFSSKNFGVLWRLEYMRVLPPVPLRAAADKPDYGKFLIDDGDDDVVAAPAPTQQAPDAEELRSMPELLDGNTGLPYFADA